MEKKQIEEMVQLLAKEFKIKVPSIKMSQGLGGYYLVKNNCLQIGKQSCLGIEGMILHEFAHALSWARYGRIKLGKRRAEWHGSKFAQCLIEIINAWHGDQTKYLWSREYKSLRAYGPK